MFVFTTLIFAESGKVFHNRKRGNVDNFAKNSRKNGAKTNPEKHTKKRGQKALK